MVTGKRLTLPNTGIENRNRARPAVGEGFPFLLFRLQDGFTVPPWLTFPEAFPSLERFKRWSPFPLPSTRKALSSLKLGFAALQPDLVRA